MTINPDKYKTINIEGRRFQISKYSPKTGLKVTKMLISKLLPVAEPIITLINGETSETALDSLGGVLSNLSFEKVSRALDLISDDELDKLIDWSLIQCEEVLPAGIVPVINKNGTYGAQGIEDDLLLVVRLTAEVIIFSATGFFGGNRLTGVLAPLLTSFKQDA